MPINTVFDSSIGPRNLPCSNLESRRPRRRLDGCRGIHHIRSPNCLPTFRSHAVFPSRPTENGRCLLAAYGTSHVKRSWSAGTSTPKNDSTASMIDLTCSLTTFAELSAAPLDCGSPSADVSCTTSPSSSSVRPSPSVSRLDLALGHKLHTLTKNLHALSAHGPQFPGTLDLNGCSVVEVHEVRHPRRIRHRWRLSEPLRLPCQHRPLHVQTRLAQPPALSLVPPTKDSKSSGNQMDPILLLLRGLTGGPGSLSLVLCPFKGLPAD